MKSFIDTVENIFTSKTTVLVKNKPLKIPMYQREYQWTQELISDLIMDIQNNPKFLGMIILDEKEDCYEIVDGQQRLTTIFLILIHIWNLYSGHQREQDVLIKFLKDDSGFPRIQNETVGQYINYSEDKVGIDISKDLDIYDQTETFNNAMETIESINYKDALMAFKNKLNKSSFLVLLRDADSVNFDQIEQVFLDINEKSKTLDNASIYKGYCFKNFNQEYYEELKNYWVRLKKIAIRCKCFEKVSLDEYIYTYLLLTHNENMPKNLSPNGRHVLEGKSTDETEKMLLSMIEFGEKVGNFYDKINNANYFFQDVCVDYASYKNASGFLLENVKRYLKYLISFKNAQYQKLPMCYFIYILYTKKKLAERMKFAEFMQVSANLFAYSIFFILSSKNKSKGDIDHTIVKILDAEDIVIKDLIITSKELRRVALANFKVPRKNKNYNQLAGLYTLMDYFDSQNNRIINTYFNAGSQDHNLEHFIIPDNRGGKITITSDEGKKNIELLHGQHTEGKSKLINCLIIDKKLNGDLLNLNAVEKIRKIKEYYNTSIPKHINIVVSFIETLETYKEVEKVMDINPIDIALVQEKYKLFLDEYFSDEKEIKLLDALTEGLKKSFHNG
ncbi:MAG: DUF262 domain-containing protein [Eubacteriales bacterium]